MTINIEALKTKFPAEFAAVYAAGREAGIAAERDRVVGHLRAGEISGASAIAHEAIADGRDVGALATEYLEAGLRRRYQRDRLDDDEAIAEAANGAVHTETVADGGDIVADIAVGRPTNFGTGRGVVK